MPIRARWRPCLRPCAADEAGVLEAGASGLADDRRGSAVFGRAARQGLELRLRQVLERIANQPNAAREVVQRPGVRVLPLVRYPYKVFYRVRSDSVLILHIRHAARQPWVERS
ncbi:MAG: type II toxin-antitoxin system RelE/ParE family toxin [Mesorhizobium sp.]